MDARRQRNSFCFQSRAHSRNGRILADARGARCRSERNSLRRNELEGAARFFGGWLPDGLQLVSWATVAQLVVDAGGRRRLISDLLRRLGCNECALVA